MCKIRLILRKIRLILKKNPSQLLLNWPENIMIHPWLFIGKKTKFLSAKNQPTSHLCHPEQSAVCMEKNTNYFRKISYKSSKQLFKKPENKTIEVEK